MNSNPESFTNKYRPYALEDFVLPGQHRLDPVIEFLSSPYPSAWLLHGRSGLGKTSMAMLMASAAARHPLAITTYPGQDLDTNTVKALGKDAKQGALFGIRNVYIINEAHTIPEGGMNRLLDVLENYGNSCWFFTTTEPLEKFSAGFKSRIKEIEFKAHGICSPASKWLMKIAQNEGLELSMAEAEGIVKEAQNNLRTAIQSVEVLCRRSQFKSQGQSLNPERKAA
jgi:replication-associated recombination protein RarA